MPESASRSLPSQRPVIIGAAAAFGILVAVAMALWAHYGSTVFFEMIAAGFAACF